MKTKQNSNLRRFLLFMLASFSCFQLTFGQGGLENPFGDPIVFPSVNFILIGQLEFDSGNISESDRVAAFVGGELRGVADVRRMGNDQLFLLSVSVSQGVEIANFKYFNAGLNQIFDLAIVDDYSGEIESTGTIGNIDDPVNFSVPTNTTGPCSLLGKELAVTWRVLGPDIGEPQGFDPTQTVSVQAGVEVIDYPSGFPLVDVDISDTQIRITKLNNRNVPARGFNGIEIGNVAGGTALDDVTKIRLNVEETTASMTGLRSRLEFHSNQKRIFINLEGLGAVAFGQDEVIVVDLECGATSCGLVGSRLAVTWRVLGPDVGEPQGFDPTQTVLVRAGVEIMDYPSGFPLVDVDISDTQIRITKLNNRNVPARGFNGIEIGDVPGGGSVLSDVTGIRLNVGQTTASVAGIDNNRLEFDSGLSRIRINLEGSRAVTFGKDEVIVIDLVCEPPPPCDLVGSELAVTWRVLGPDVGEPQGFDPTQTVLVRAGVEIMDYPSGFPLVDVDISDTQIRITKLNNRNVPARSFNGIEIKDVAGGTVLTDVTEIGVNVGETTASVTGLSSRLEFDSGLSRIRINLEGLRAVAFSKDEVIVIDLVCEPPPPCDLIGSELAVTWRVLGPDVGEPQGFDPTQTVLVRAGVEIMDYPGGFPLVDVDISDTQIRITKLNNRNVPARGFNGIEIGDVPGGGSVLSDVTGIRLNVGQTTASVAGIDNNRLEFDSGLSRIRINLEGLRAVTFGKDEVIVIDLVCEPPPPCDLVGSELAVTWRVLGPDVGEPQGFDPTQTVLVRAGVEIMDYPSGFPLVDVDISDTQIRITKLNNRNVPARSFNGIEIKDVAGGTVLTDVTEIGVNVGETTASVPGLSSRLEFDSGLSRIRINLEGLRAVTFDKDEVIVIDLVCAPPPPCDLVGSELAVTWRVLGPDVGEPQGFDPTQTVLVRAGVEIMDYPSGFPLVDVDISDTQIRITKLNNRNVPARSFNGIEIKDVAGGTVLTDVTKIGVNVGETTASVPGLSSRLEFDSGLSRIRINLEGVSAVAFSKDEVIVIDLVCEPPPPCDLVGSELAVTWRVLGPDVGEPQGFDPTQTVLVRAGVEIMDYPSGFPLVDVDISDTQIRITKLNNRNVPARSFNGIEIKDVAGGTVLTDVTEIGVNVGETTASVTGLSSRLEFDSSLSLIRINLEGLSAVAFSKDEVVVVDLLCTSDSFLVASLAVENKIRTEASPDTTQEVEGIVAVIRSSTIYEDSEDGTTKGWWSYGLGNVENLITTDGGRIMATYIEEDSDSFRLGLEDNSDWNNTNEFYAYVAVIMEEEASVYFRLATKQGDYYIRYSPDDQGAPEVMDNVVHIGLGIPIDGSWYTIHRDLEVDLKSGFPDLELLSVKDFYVFGSIKLDNLMLLDYE